MFIDLADEVDLRNKASGSWLKPFGSLIACISLIRVVEGNEAFIDLLKTVELEPVPEFSAKNTVGSFDRSLIPRLPWRGEDRKDFLLQQEEHDAVENSRPWSCSGKSEAIIDLDNVGLLKAPEECLAVLDDFSGRLRLNTFEVLEFTGESERKGDEVHWLGSARDKLFPDEVDLHKALAKAVDRSLGIMQVTADTLVTHLALER